MNASTELLIYDCRLPIEKEAISHQRSAFSQRGLTDDQTQRGPWPQQQRKTPTQRGLWAAAFFSC
jgi:hypothetical protein